MIISVFRAQFIANNCVPHVVNWSRNQKYSRVMAANSQFSFNVSAGQLSITDSGKVLDF